MKATTKKRQFTHLILTVVMATLMGCTVTENAAQRTALDSSPLQDNQTGSKDMPTMAGTRQVNLGTVEVGRPRAVGMFSFTNASTTKMSGRIDVTAVPGLQMSNLCADSLEARQSCFASLQYSPSMPGPFSHSLRVQYAGRAMGTIQFSGNALEAAPGSDPFSFVDLFPTPTEVETPAPIVQPPQPLPTPVVVVPPMPTPIPTAPIPATPLLTQIDILNDTGAPAHNMVLAPTQVGSEQVLTLILRNSGPVDATFSGAYFFNNASFTVVEESSSTEGKCPTNYFLNHVWTLPRGQACRLLVRYQPTGATSSAGEEAQLWIWTQTTQHIATLKGRAYPRVAPMGLFRLVDPKIVNGITQLEHLLHLYSDQLHSDELSALTGTQYYTDDLNVAPEVSVPFYYYPQEVEGTTKVYFLKNIASGQNYLTLHSSSIAGWKPAAGQPATYLYATPPDAGLVPTAVIHHLYNVKTGNHYYTQHRFEKESLLSYPETWRNDGILAHAPLNQTRISNFTVTPGETVSTKTFEWQSTPGSDCTLVGWNTEKRIVTVIEDGIEKTVVNEFVKNSSTLLQHVPNTFRIALNTSSFTRFELKCRTGFSTTALNGEAATRYDIHSLVVDTATDGRR